MTPEEHARYRSKYAKVTVLILGVVFGIIAVVAVASL
jgi:hypothetical protein